MTQPTRRALADAVQGTPLAGRIDSYAAPFLERRARDLAGLDLPEPALRGLARVLTSNAEFARYLSLRPGVLERLRAVDASSLGHRAAQLSSVAPRATGADLEGFLDSLRLFRRDEMAFAACLDLADLVPFEEVSSFLSGVAEVVIERALAAAVQGVASGSDLGFAILAMGKLAGRELTYHSDLDLIFLYDGATEGVTAASRVAQLLIHCLTTPTGAGTAYAIDARLRPSGRQGLLVSGYEAYASYQLEKAQPWEHLALMRARIVEGDRGRAAGVLERVQTAVRARRTRPWAEVEALRSRIAAERTRESDARRGFKTGPGGLMDVDFLAAGAQLERGADCAPPVLPSVPVMLSSVASGRGLDTVLAGYRFLRRVEARARWVAGRSVEALSRDEKTLASVAELVEPRLPAQSLLERVRSLRAGVLEAYERVRSAGTIGAL